MNNIREIHPEDEARLQSLVNLIDRIMPVRKWGFKLNSKFIATSRPDMDLTSRSSRFPTVIYDSEYCRTLFSLRRDIKGYELMIAYGRAHAPDDEQIIKWNGEDCYCWHWDVYGLVLKFLDGLSPREAVLSRGKPPKGLKDFLGLDLQKTMSEVEFTVRYHGAIWNYYGKPLFELFDLRHPELWEEYFRFVKEYYDRYRRPRNLTPSPDKIC